MPSAMTTQRRTAVLREWSRRDRLIAEILIEQGLVGRIKRTADGREAQLQAGRVIVSRARAFWRKEWRKQSRATRRDANETRGEYLARLDSFASDALALLEDPTQGATSRVQALGELRQIEQAKAKACGVAVAPPIPEEPLAAPHVLGIMFEKSNHQETR